MLPRTRLGPITEPTPDHCNAHAGGQRHARQSVRRQTVSLARCHRVLRSSGQLVPDRGGPEAQLIALEHTDASIAEPPT